MQFRDFIETYPGDRLKIVWPASPSKWEAVETGLPILLEMGYLAAPQGAAEGPWPYLSGDDEGRAEELRSALADPEISGTICARGGYGCHRTAPHLDFAELVGQAKPVVGFSDITVLLSGLLAHGLKSIHGPSLSTLAIQPPEYIARLGLILEGRWAEVEPLPGEPLADGDPVRGYLTGGNLTILAHLTGTPWQPPSKGGIIFLEDIGEKLYRLDRCLSHLLAAGFFEGCKGVVLGRFEKCDYESLLELATELLSPLGVPILGRLDFGHDGPNASLLVGGRAELDPESGELRALADEV